MTVGAVAGVELDEAAGPESYARAVLNILADFGDERARLAEVQKALLNILEDFDAEKNKVELSNREMAREIAERKQAEEALLQAKAAADAANRELEAFSYSVAHDLRAPLRAVDGFSRILLEDYGPQLSADCQGYLRDVRDNTRKMGRLIDDLLAFSRLSRQPLRKQPVALGDLVRQCFDDLRADRETRRVELVVGDLPTCEVDPGLVRQVLVNLLSNALKFTRGRDVARVEVGSHGEGGEKVCYVRDNGVGFDMGYADKLFGVFQRLHRAEEYEGTGVGLAIAQRIIHRHGGRIWTEAAVDSGATFYFTLEGGAAHG